MSEETMVSQKRASQPQAKQWKGWSSCVQRARLEDTLLSYAEFTKGGRPHAAGSEVWGQDLVNYARKVGLTKTCMVHGTTIERPYNLGELKAGVSYLMRHHPRDQEGATCERFYELGRDAITEDRLEHVQETLRDAKRISTSSSGPRSSARGSSSRLNAKLENILRDDAGSTTELALASDSPVQTSENPPGVYSLESPIVHVLEVEAAPKSSAGQLAGSIRPMPATFEHVADAQRRGAFNTSPSKSEVARKTSEWTEIEEWPLHQSVPNSPDIPNDSASATNGSRRRDSTISASESADDDIKVHPWEQHTHQAYRQPTPDIDSFAIRSSEVVRGFKDIFTSTEALVSTAFDLAGLERSQQADFEPVAGSTLKKLYTTLFGDISWKTTSADLQLKGIPKAFDALLSLIIAAVHIQVFDQARRGPGVSRVSFASELYRRHLESVLNQYANCDLETLLRIADHHEVRDADFAVAEVAPMALRLAEDVNLALGHHLSRLTALVPARRHLAFGSSWRSGLVEIFAKAIKLNERLRIATETYTFQWYIFGQKFARETMKDRYPADEHDVVFLTLFPCVQLHNGENAEPVTISKAQVIGGTAEVPSVAATRS